MHRQLFTRERERERDREKVKVWFLWSWEEICLASKSWIAETTLWLTSKSTCWKRFGKNFVQKCWSRKLGSPLQRSAHFFFHPKFAPCPKTSSKAIASWQGKSQAQRHLKRTLHMLGIALKGTFQLYAFIFESKYSLPFHAVFLSI